MAEFATKKRQKKWSKGRAEDIVITSTNLKAKKKGFKSEKIYFT